jgi:hypothetical protein
MPLWDKVKQELDRAGRVAQDAIDEGRIRLDAFRARQLADKAAQALGYAVYHARQGGGDIESDAYGRLSATLAGHEAEASRLEAQLESVRRGSDATAESPAAGMHDAGAAGGASAAGYSSTAGYASTADTGPMPASGSVPRTGGAAPPPSAGTGPAEPWSPSI